VLLDQAGHAVAARALALGAGDAQHLQPAGEVTPKVIAPGRRVGERSVMLRTSRLRAPVKPPSVRVPVYRVGGAKATSLALR
jgi:hypothetical protein